MLSNNQIWLETEELMLHIRPNYVIMQFATEKNGSTVREACLPRFIGTFEEWIFNPCHYKCNEFLVPSIQNFFYDQEQT